MAINTSYNLRISAPTNLCQATPGPRPHSPSIPGPDGGLTTLTRHFYTISAVLPYLQRQSSNRLHLCPFPIGLPPWSTTRPGRHHPNSNRFIRPGILPLLNRLTTNCPRGLLSAASQGGIARNLIGLPREQIRKAKAGEADSPSRNPRL